MSERPDYPKTNMAILTRKTGKDGSYFVGFAGMQMLTLTKLPKPDDDGNECWILKASNPPKRDNRDAGAADRRSQHDAPPRQATSNDGFDTDIPF